jgi:hypothetical protein
MNEKATMDTIDAAIEAFGSERLRWLVGKGDVLIQYGELTKERYDQLVKQTVREEIERSIIRKHLEDSPRPVSYLAKKTKLDSDVILWNLLAMMKWNQVEIVGEEKREYLYSQKEVSVSTGSAASTKTTIVPAEAEGEN